MAVLAPLSGPSPQTEPFDLAPRTEMEFVLSAVLLQPSADAVQRIDVDPQRHELDPGTANLRKICQIALDFVTVGPLADHELELVLVLRNQPPYHVRNVAGTLMTAGPAWSQLLVGGRIG